MKLYTYLQVLAGTELKERASTGAALSSSEMGRPPAQSSAPALALSSSETGLTRRGVAASSTSV